MAEVQKTGVSEAAIGLGVGAGAVSILEPVLQYIIGHPVLPDPWDKLAIGVLAAAIWGARKIQKRQAAKAAA